MSYDDFPIYDAEAEPPVVEPDAEPRVIRSRGPQAETEELISRVVDIVQASRPMLRSSSAMVPRDEVLDLLEQAMARLPDELREARWLRKEREDYLAKMRADGDDILDAARAQAERMVQRTEVVKAAEQRARRIVDAAEAEARRLRLECEDFCDQKLAGFEIVLERTLKMVGSGRERLNATNLPRPPAPEEAEVDAAVEESGFFDQDRG